MDNLCSLAGFRFAKDSNWISTIIIDEVPHPYALESEYLSNHPHALLAHCQKFVCFAAAGGKPYHRNSESVFSDSTCHFRQYPRLSVVTRILTYSYKRMKLYNWIPRWIVWFYWTVLYMELVARAMRPLCDLLLAAAAKFLLGLLLFIWATRVSACQGLYLTKFGVWASIHCLCIRNKFVAVDSYCCA